MRRIILLLLISICCAAVGVEIASAHDKDKSKVIHQPMVNIYTSPSLKAKLVESDSPSTYLVAIFHKDKDWVKVANPKNGEVGWLNRGQYQEALQAYYKPQVQAVFVHSVTGKNGKPDVKVVAYDNGNKLSDKQTKKLYEQIVKHQARESRFMQDMFWNVDSIMNQQILEGEKLLAPWNHVDFGFTPEIIQPIFIVQHNDPAHTNK